MKRLALPLFASLLAAASSQTFAQSAVTLYGVADEGITYGNNVGGGAQWAAASGTMSGSRFGLRGVEDLGSGLKAVFNLENGYDLSTG
ncbi:outer membrane protein (porin) [Caballeronia fortuita]|uniref:Outer membrane protein (Porin) n=1 Tax=Caballeronia fortuita TaxID=1777138 RepID=A0A157ZU61_9BURK|nr:outer membrane protein (porin) [Caballeronia fortuita]